MRIVYMGTPEIARVILKALINTRHEIIAVVSQTDKPKGRGGKVQFTPVKEEALAAGIPVYQPNTIKDDEFFNLLCELNPDIIVVAAYGKILPKRIIDLPKLGCINVHASILPKYRGAAPIQWVVINGEKTTGITIMHMDVGIDTGDMIIKREVVLDEKETSGTLNDKLANCGGELLIEALDLIEAGKAPREKQNDEDATYYSMLTKELGHIDFTKSAVEIERLIRGLNPWPSAYGFLDGKSFKIWSADVILEDRDGEPGEIIDITKDTILVKTGNGILSIKELQLEGKKRMTSDAFLRGFTLAIGTKIN